MPNVSIQITSFNWAFTAERYADDWGTVYILLGKLRISLQRRASKWNLQKVTGS